MAELFTERDMIPLLKLIEESRSVDTKKQARRGPKQLRLFKELHEEMAEAPTWVDTGGAPRKVTAAERLSQSPLLRRLKKEGKAESAKAKMLMYYLPEKQKKIVSGLIKGERVPSMSRRVEGEVPEGVAKEAAKKFKGREKYDFDIDTPPEIGETHELAQFEDDAPPTKTRRLADAYQGRDVTETLRNVETELKGNRSAQRKALAEILEHPEAGKLKADVVRRIAPEAYKNWEWGVLKNLETMGKDAGEAGSMARNAVAALKQGNLAAANAFSAAAYTASKGQNFERMEETARAYLRGESVHPTTPLNVQRTIDADDVEVQIGKSANERVPEWKWQQAERKAAVGDEFNPPGSRSAEEVLRSEERTRTTAEEMRLAKKQQAVPKAQGGPTRYAPGQGLLIKKVTKDTRERFPWTGERKLTAQEVVNLRTDLFPPGQKPSAVGQGFVDALEKVWRGEATLEPGAGATKKPKIYGKTDWSKKNLAELAAKEAGRLKGDHKQTALLKLIEDVARGKPAPKQLTKRAGMLLKLLRLL